MSPAKTLFNSIEFMFICLDCVPLTVAVETVTTVASIESVVTHCIHGRHLLPVRLKLIFAESRGNFQGKLLSKRDGEIIYFFL